MVDDRPLTPEELVKLRELLEKDARVVWFWSTFRVWTIGIATALAAGYALIQGFKDLIKWGSN